MTASAILGGSPVVTIPQPHFTWPLIDQEAEQAVLAQLRSGELSYYRRAGIIAEFEDDFAAYHQAPYAMSTHSGTGALHAAFFSLGLAPGDEVIAPAYTHLSSVMPMLHVNLIPVLCDVDTETGNIDPEKIVKGITGRTRAIIVTHQYGHICDMESILAIARRHELFVIEDCSHAHGATYKGMLAGTFGDVGCFSLQSQKALPVGEGGMLITGNPGLFERMTLLAHFRQKTGATTEQWEPLVETGYGLKFRLHPLAAALGVVKLKKLNMIIDARQSNYDYFCSRLQSIPGVRPLVTREGFRRGGFFRFLIKYQPEELLGLSADAYVQALQAEGVSTVMAGSLAKPLHLTHFFQSLNDNMYPTGWPRQGDHVSHRYVYKRGDFPCAENFSAATLQFPAFTEPSRHIIDEYCQAMLKVAHNKESLVSHFHAAGKNM